MITHTALLALLCLSAALAPAGPAHAADLLDVNECHAHRLPDARADCEKRRKAKERAFRLEQERQRREKDGARKPSETLCFRRGPDRELVCPNT